MSVKKSLITLLLLIISHASFAQHTLFFEDFMPSHSKRAWTYDSDKWIIDDFSAMPSGKPSLMIGYVKNNPVFGEPLRGIFRAISPKIRTKDHEAIYASIYLYFEGPSDISGKSFNIEYRTHDTAPWLNYSNPSILFGTVHGQLFVELPKNIDADSIQFSLTFRSLNANTYSPFLLIVDDFTIGCVDMYSALLKSKTPSIQSFVDPILHVDVFNNGKPFDSICIAYSKRREPPKYYTHRQSVASFKSADLDIPLTSYFLSQGEKEVRFWIDKINGKDPEYPEIQDTLIVHSQMIKQVDSNTFRHNMLEYFGSIHCPFCVSLNNSIITPIIHDSSNISKIACAYIPLSFPLSADGQPDPYYFKDLSKRQALYNINKIPSLIINGKDFNFPTILDYNTALREMLSKDPELAFFKIDVHSATIDPDTYRISVIGDYISHFRGAINMHAFVTQRTFTGTVTPDGHTEFFDFIIAAMPSIDGKTLVFEQDTTPFYLEYHDIENSFANGFSNLNLNLFIQEIHSKEIFQTVNVPIAYQSNSANKPNSEQSQLLIFPNPSSEKINIHFPSSLGKLSIFNLKGQLMYHNENTGPTHEISLLSWEPGLYIIHWRNGTEVIHAKMTVK